jgi:hypothetical protein
LTSSTNERSAIVVLSSCRSWEDAFRLPHHTFYNVDK